jgi:hypothetical protein
MASNVQGISREQRAAWWVGSAQRQRALDSWQNDKPTCPNCGGDIRLRSGVKVSRMRQQKFCSRRCSLISRARERYPKVLPDGVCDFCKKEIPTTRKFCGVLCKKRFKHQAGRSAKPKNYSARRKSRCVEYKGGSCQGCGYNRCVQALQFHHRNPAEKDFAISEKNQAWPVVKAELDKCALLCANCHAEVHAGIRTIEPDWLNDFEQGRELKNVKVA